MNQEMNPTRRSTPTTPQQIKNIGIGFLSFVADPVTLGLRNKIGFRRLKPLKVVLLTGAMFTFGYFVPAGDSGGGDVIPVPIVALPQSNIPAGLDSPLPASWPRLNYGTQAAWLNKHRLSPQQQQARQQREAKEREALQAEAQAKAERAMRWAKFKGHLTRWPMFGFALAFLVTGLYQRRSRWKDLLNGVKWHTYSRGVPYLSKLLGDLIPETWIVRFADPLGVFITGLCTLAVTRALGLWLMFSAFSLYAVEQEVYDRQLNHVLDVLDNLVDAENVYDVVSMFKKGGKNGEKSSTKGIEENNGVLSTSAMLPDALRRREQRDGRELRRLQREEAMFAEADSYLANGPIDPPPSKPKGSGLADSDERL